MEYLKTFEEFTNKLNEYIVEQKDKDRRQLLADIKKTQYAIVLTFEDPAEGEDLGLLLERDQYTQFKKTWNRYTYHPADPNIPVKAHYHIYPSNSKKEFYAVNVDDGSAHHKIHRGYQVPKKEAEELRSLGVKIKPDNLLEEIDYEFDEEIVGEYLTIYLIIDEG